jgi:hypothetical protein
MRLVTAIGCAVLLSGCADGALGVRGSPAWRMTAPDSAQREFFTGVCLDKGYKLNTPEMDACVRSRPRSSGGIGYSGNDSSESRMRALEARQRQMEDARRTECILGGGSYGGGQCFKF